MNRKEILLLHILFITLFYSFTACSEAEQNEVVIEPPPESLVDEDTIEVDSLQDIKEWFNVLCSAELGGRYSGSEGIGKAVDYISGILGRSDSLEIDTYTTDKCEMRNLIFHIKGENDSLVVLGAHYDAFGYNNKIALPGADDNMSGVAVLLKLIKIIQKSNFHPKYSMDICFFDGEEIGRYGSRQYIYKTHNVIKYINIDTCGNQDSGIGVFYDPNNPNLKDEFEVFISMIKDVKTTVFEYIPDGYITDCQYFERRGVPFVSIMNDRTTGYNHTMEDNISHISFEHILNISSALFEYIRKL